MAITTDGPVRSRAELAVRFPLLTRVGLVSVWAVGTLALVRGIQLGITKSNLGSDAHAYWLTRDGWAYDLAPGQPDAFLYSPAFAQAAQVVTWLPYPAFLTAWITLEALVLVWLLAPLRPVWAIPLGMLCVPELVNGNVYVLLAGVAVAGLRWPALWAFAVLTKLLPGLAAGWFALRGEWTRFSWAVGATLVVAAVSALAAPDLWEEWLRFVLASSDGTREPTWVFATRCAVGLGVLAWGARTDRPWAVAVTMTLLSPALAPTTATILIAVPRLLELRTAAPDSSSPVAGTRFARS